MSPRVEMIETGELDDRSYVADDGENAMVIAPQRDLDRVEDLLAARGLRGVLVTGGLVLALRTGAPYAVAAADDVAFERRAVVDGDELTAGGLRVRVVATPGHTDTRGSYVVDDGDGPAAVFTGGSLLHGSVGRTDLVDPDRTEELMRTQFHSARRLSEISGDDDEIFPTHGFGSFCSSGSATGGATATMAVERARTDALTATDDDALVARLVAGLTADPRYYAHMGARNRQRPGPAASRRSSRWPPTSCASGSRPGNGWWTCATAPRMPPSTSPAASASRSESSSPPTSAGSSRGAPR